MCTKNKWRCVAIRNIGADADFNLTVKMLPAIAFCPVADEVDAVETLAEDIGDDYQGMLDYFEDTFICRPGRRHRRDPRFSHDMWNVFHCTLQELPRTNNNIEGWHVVFYSSLVPVIQTSGLSLESWKGNSHFIIFNWHWYFLVMWFLNERNTKMQQAVYFT